MAVSRGTPLLLLAAMALASVLVLYSSVASAEIVTQGLGPIVVSVSDNVPPAFNVCVSGLAPCLQWQAEAVEERDPADPSQLRPTATRFPASAWTYTDTTLLTLLEGQSYRIQYRATMTGTAALLIELSFSSDAMNRTTLQPSAAVQVAMPVYAVQWGITLTGGYPWVDGADTSRLLALEGTLVLPGDTLQTGLDGSGRSTSSLLASSSTNTGASAPSLQATFLPQVYVDSDSYALSVVNSSLPLNSGTLQFLMPAYDTSLDAAGTYMQLRFAPSTTGSSHKRRHIFFRPEFYVWTIVLIVFVLLCWLCLALGGLTLFIVGKWRDAHPPTD